MKTLVEKAKEVRTRKRGAVTEEQYELALAWVKGDVGFREIKEVLGYKSPTAVYIFLADCFRYSINKH